MVDLERRLADYGSELDRTAQPVGLVEVAAKLERPVRVLRTRRERAWLVAAAAAVLVLLAFIPILAGVFRSGDPVVDQPASTAVPAVSTTVSQTDTTAATVATERSPGPVDVDEPFQSSLGTWVWTRVDGDADTVPAHGIQPGSGGGYVAAEGDRTWTSADGLSWTFSGDVGAGDGWTATFQIGDTEWRRRSTSEGASHERLVDGEWKQVAVPQPTPPYGAGLTWSSASFRDPAAIGDTIVIPATAHGSVDFGAYYGTVPHPYREGELVGPSPEWDRVSDTLRLVKYRFLPGGTANSYSMEEEEVVGVVEVRIEAGAPDVIVFVDTDTSDVVATVESTFPGLSANDLRERLIRGWMDHPSLFVSRDGGASFVTTEVPWAQGGQTISAIGGEFSSYVILRGPDYQLGEVEVWTSRDGLSWNQGDPPAFLAGQIDWVEVNTAGDLTFATVVVEDRTELWVATGDTGWRRIDALSSGSIDWIDNVAQTSFGYLISAMVHDGPAGLVEIWVSPDGVEWEVIPGARDIHEPYGAGSFGVDVAGDRAFAVVTNDDGPRTLWMGRFTD